MTDLTQKALDRIQQARVNLVLLQPFFSVLALRLHPVVDAGAKTFWTDGYRLGYSPAYVEQLTDAEIEGVICHEVLHCANGHIWRRAGREGGKWNRAADYSINPIVLEAGMTLPKGALIDQAFTGHSAESIYGQLPDSPPDGGNGDGDGGGCGEVRDPASGDGKDENGDDQANVSPMIAPPTEAEWQVAVLQAAQAAKMMGKLPASLERLVDQIKHPAVDWRAALRRFVEQQAKADYSWSRPNARFVASGLYLPSIKSESMPALGVVLDTSGSISGLELSTFLAEMLSIAEECQPEAIHIVCCDAAVYAMGEFARGEEIKIKPKGGGGTDLRLGLKYFEEKDITLACAVVFTDLFTPFGDPPQFPVLWCTDSRESAPYGETLRIDLERMP